MKETFYGPMPERTSEEYRVRLWLEDAICFSYHEAHTSEGRHMTPYEDLRRARESIDFAARILTERGEVDVEKTLLCLVRGLDSLCRVATRHMDQIEEHDTRIAEGDE